MWEWTHWKRPGCWERLKAGGEGEDRGWGGWMASLTQWPWVWVSSRREWRTGKPGVLRSTGSQRVGPDWATAQPQQWQKLCHSFCRLWPYAGKAARAGNSESGDSDSLLALPTRVPLIWVHSFLALLTMRIICFRITHTLWLLNILVTPLINFILPHVAPRFQGSVSEVEAAFLNVPKCWSIVP